MFITSIYFVRKNAGITMIFKLLLPANSATVSVKYFAKTNKSDLGWPDDFSKMDLQTWNFAQGVWSGCSTYSYKKKFRKIFRLRKTRIFDISKTYLPNLTKVCSKDAEFYSDSELWKISRRTSGLDGK